MKKFFIFVLTCLIVSTMAITLVGCEKTDTEIENIGTYEFDTATIVSNGDIDSEKTLEQYIAAQKPVVGGKESPVQIAIDKTGDTYMVDGVKLDTKEESDTVTMTVNVEDLELTLPDSSKFKLTEEKYVLQGDTLTYVQKWVSVSDSDTNYTITSTFVKVVKKPDKADEGKTEGEAA